MISDYDRHLRLAAQDRQQIQLAAESMLNTSVSSHRSSYTQSVRTPEAISEVLIAGSRPDGRMSSVRRFFCLFVTFDLLFTVLMWLICIMISGANVQAAFVQQIVHYQIKTSLFDIVMAAICRFTVLLLFYALLHINHWCIVAISTTSTCALLLTKVFLYDWSQSSQPVFQVFLVLTSFVLVWGEVWFLDIKVIPQETQAQNWFFGFGDSERAPLLSPSVMAVPSHSMEGANHFYTPLDSPDNSDIEDNTVNQKEVSSFPFLATIALKLSPDKIVECKKSVSTLVEKSYKLITAENWKIERITDDNDEIAYMTLPKPDGKIFKITGIINMSAEKLINDLFDNIESSPTWNKQVSESKIIYTLDESSDIVYQATNDLGNGSIGARDFVILRHRGQHDTYFINSGISVNFSTIPIRKNFVRGWNGVGCFATRSLGIGAENKCQFIWLLNTNLKGWIPRKLVDMSMSSALVDFMRTLRLHARTLKD